ncbi:MAG: hypothetical protein RR033_05385 [Clostridia bacterium]
MKKQIIFLVCTILCTLAIGAGSIAYASNYIITSANFNSNRPLVNDYCDIQEQQYVNDGVTYFMTTTVTRSGKVAKTRTVVQDCTKRISIFSSVIIESAAGFSGNDNATIKDSSTLELTASLPWNAFNVVRTYHGATSEQRSATSTTGGIIGLSQIIQYQ